MDKKMRKAIQDMVTGLCLLCLGLVLIFFVIPDQIKVRSRLSASASSGVSSRGFPLFSCWIIVIAAAMLVISSLVKFVVLKKESAQAAADGGAKKQKKTNMRWADEGRAVLLILLCAVYMLLFAKIGYIWATLIVPPFMLLLLGGKSWKAFVSVYGFGIVIYILFRFVMHVPLP